MSLKELPFYAYFYFPLNVCVRVRGEKSLRGAVFGEVFQNVIADRFSSAAGAQLAPYIQFRERQGDMDDNLIGTVI